MLSRLMQRPWRQRISVTPLQPAGGISFVGVLIYRLISGTYPEWIVLTTPVDNEY
jgi:hypothetical protein